MPPFADLRAQGASARGRRRTCRAAGLTLGLALSHSATLRGQAPPVFPSGVDVVAVDVSVVDGDGRPVRGLGPGDFSLRVGGRPRRIVSVEFVADADDTADVPGSTGAEPPEPSSGDYSTNEVARPGRLILLVVDQGNISIGEGRGAIATADKLLDRLSPADKVGLLTVPGPEPRVEFTTKQALVKDAMRSLVGRRQLAGRRVSLTEALAYDRKDDLEKWRGAVLRECSSSDTSCIRGLETEAQTVAWDYRQASQASLNVLRALFDTLKTIEAPKTVVLITQGLSEPDSGSREGFGFSSDIRPLGEAAATARVSLYAVRVEEAGGPVAADRELSAAAWREDRMFQEHGLETLADVARGVVLRGSPEIAFTRIAREISGHYLLGFEAEGTERDGKNHGLQVTVARPGVTVRTWRSVRIPPPSSPKQEEESLVASLRSPQAAAAMPVRVATYALPDPGSGKVRVLVSAELGREGSPGGLSVAYVMVDGKGRVQTSASQRAKDAAAGEGRVPFVTSLLVEPGLYTLKLAARDRSGRMGRVDHPVKALLTSTGGDVETGDLLLGPVPAPGAGFRPAVGPDIAGPAVVARWDVCAREPGRLEGGHALVEVAADEMAPALRSFPVRLAATDAPGRRVVQAVLPLADLAPGRYVVRASLSLPGRPRATAVHALWVAAARTPGP